MWWYNWLSLFIIKTWYKFIMWQSNLIIRFNNFDTIILIRIINNIKWL